MRLLSTTQTRPLYSAASAFAVPQEPLKAEDIGMCRMESYDRRISSHRPVIASGAGCEVETSAPPLSISKKRSYVQVTPSKYSRPSTIKGMGSRKISSFLASSAEMLLFVSVTTAIRLMAVQSFLFDRVPKRGAEIHNIYTIRKNKICQYKTRRISEKIACKGCISVLY